MVGILILLLFSAILLYTVHGRSILALGFLPVKKRLTQVSIGFAVTALLCGAVQYLEASVINAKWMLRDISIGGMLNLFYWDFKSVFTEELIFRGAALYVLIKNFNNTTGILVSAFFFGIYHWFSFGVFGQPVPMVVVFLGTGLMGYALALAFVRTESILLPLGLHLGWNFTYNSIFSKGPLKEGLIKVFDGETMPSWLSLIGMVGVPFILLLLIYFFTEKWAQSQES